MARLTGTKLSGFVKELLRQWSRCNLGRSAAALTYYLVLSLFPLLICLNACLGIFQLDVRALLESLQRVLPADALALAEDYVDYLSQNHSALLLPTGVSTMLLSGSAGVRLLLDSTDEFYCAPRRSGLRRIAVSVLFSFLLLVSIYLSMVVVLAGEWLFNAVRGVLPPEVTGMLGLDQITSLWLSLRYVLLFGFVLLLVLVLYRLGASHRKVSKRIICLSSLLSALALVGVSALFSWFINMSTKYSLLYGSLASVIILLLWLYWCGTVLLAGSLLCAVWHRQTGGAPPEAAPEKE